MTSDDFREEIATLTFGKRLPEALYVFAPTSNNLPDRLRELVDGLRRRLEIPEAFNVLKFSNDFALSFLEYAEFFECPHPTLVRSVRVQLATGKIKKLSYDQKGNPPILHRKECLLPPNHERANEFALLTRQEEAAGLYVQTSTIGFRANWEQLLRSKGLTYRNHELIAIQESADRATQNDSDTVRVHRHRTAISRTDLSRPIRQAIELGILREGKSVFDYGCGLGTDADGLRALGYTAANWDPAYFPENSKEVADVVNLGYVINVIEDPVERVAVLVDAWRYTREALVVSTMVRGQESYDSVREHADGVLTSRNTFQKYFEPSEIQGLIESALDTEAHALALGIYVVFRDARAAQSFLSSRSRRQIDWEQISSRLGFLKPKRKLGVVDLYSQHKELLDSFWDCVLNLGRLPSAGEFSREGELKEKIGGPKKVHRLFIEHYGPDTYDTARRQRREDLLVYLALANFRTRIPQKHLDDRLQRDLVSHFGGYKQAQAEGLELLMSLGASAALESAIANLSFGWFDKAEGHFSIHRSLLDLLPPSLRIFIGCGAQLYGNPKEADVIKIHARSRKLTFLFYDDFDEKPFPVLRTRIKIDIPRLTVSVFNYDEGADSQILFFKERFVGADYLARKRMETISRRLAVLGIDPSTLGSNDKNAPSREQFEAMLKHRRLRSDLTKLPELNST